MTTDHSFLVMKDYTSDDYLRALAGRKQKHGTEGPLFFKVAIGFCVAGLVMLYFGFTVLAVALLVIAAFFQSGSSHSLLMRDVLDEQYYLAQVIAAQHALDLSVIQSELTLPRFYRHLHKGENGEIGGDHASKHSTSVYRGI